MIKSPFRITRRVFLGTAFISSALLSSCGAKPMRAFLDISLFSYLDRPIFDVDMNGTDFMSALPHSFYGANSIMVEQPITLGPQVVTWRLAGPEGMPGNGDTVRAKNIPILDEIPKEVKWLALHIYNDSTVEIALSKRSRAELETERGKKIIEEWTRKHGK